MPGREETRHPVHGLPEIVTSTLFGHARVQGHPNPDLPYSVRPLGLMERMLCLKGSGNGIVGSVECSAEGIANRLEDVAAILLYRFTHDGVVAGEGSAHL